MVKYRTNGERDEVVYPQTYGMLGSLERATALNVPEGAVCIGDVVYESLEAVPEELRELAKKIFSGDEASNKAEFEVKAKSK